MNKYDRNLILLQESVIDDYNTINSLKTLTNNNLSYSDTIYYTESVSSVIGKIIDKIREMIKTIVDKIKELFAGKKESKLPDNAPVKIKKSVVQKTKQLPKILAILKKYIMLVVNGIKKGILPIATAVGNVTVNAGKLRAERRAKEIGTYLDNHMDRDAEKMKADIAAIEQYKNMIEYNKAEIITQNKNDSKDVNKTSAYTTINAAACYQMIDLMNKQMLEIDKEISNINSKNDNKYNLDCLHQLNWLVQEYNNTINACAYSLNKAGASEYMAITKTSKDVANNISNTLNDFNTSKDGKNIDKMCKEMVRDQRRWMAKYGNKINKLRQAGSASGANQILLKSSLDFEELTKNYRDLTILPNFKYQSHAKDVISGMLEIKNIYKG